MCHMSKQSRIPGTGTCFAEPQDRARQQQQHEKGCGNVGLPLDGSVGRHTLAQFRQANKLF